MNVITYTYRGAALAVVVAFSLQPILLIVYIWYRRLHKKTWGGWSWQSLDEWGQFLKLGVPGFLMISFEWWTYEISVLVTGSIDKTQLAVNTILIQLLTFAFMVNVLYIHFLHVHTCTSVAVSETCIRPIKNFSKKLFPPLLYTHNYMMYYYCIDSSGDWYGCQCTCWK